uniref:E3 ubiquitin-protein ligase Topors n=1 Tax=Esox lucius TaxID=8010 RepID=A0A3P9A8X2_ESOLU
MAAAKMSIQRHKRSVLDKASDKTSKVLPAEASPDSKCPICLDKFNNMAYLDLCLHKFCFRCIHEWSKNKAECPLCKQPFHSIYHSIKSEKDFKQYDLRPVENGSFGNFAGERFRYRTTLTGQRRHDQRRTSPPPDNGVMFEALTGDSPSPRQDRGLRRMLARLAARRRAESEGRAMRSLREQEMIDFRRALYRRGVRVRSVRDGGRSRDISAEFLQANPACLHRLLPWLKRELVVLYGAHGSLVNIVQHVIMSRITRYNMEDQAMQEELQPFLQARTDHFLHEFINFARSPFNMEAYDQHAVYDCPAPSSDEGGSLDSSVIAISEDDDGAGDLADLDPVGDSVSGGDTSRAAWDDETPGPSHSSAEPARPVALSIRDSDSESSAEGDCEAVSQPSAPRPRTDSARIKTDRSPRVSSGDEDCVIVGYVKPLAERTPELVKLSSDSEGSVLEESRDTVPGLPQHIRFTSVSPTPSQRQCPGGSDGADREPDVSGSGGRCRASPYGGRETSSSKDEKHRRRHTSRDRSRGSPRSRSKGRGRRPRSADLRRSTKSPAVSINSDSTLSRGRRQSRSRSHDRSHTHGEKRRANKEGTRPGRGRESSSHSFHWQFYSRERDGSAAIYTERTSYYSSSHWKPNRRSPTRSRDSQRRDKRRSRSGSHSSAGSPSDSHRKSHHEKPGGKRKYKTRHLEEPPPRDLTSDAAGEPPSPTGSSGVKDKGKSRDGRRRNSREKLGGGRCRSLSVEIIYDGGGGGGGSSEQTGRRHKKKKKHKKKSKKHRSKERPVLSGRPATVINIDSDSDQHAADTHPTGLNHLF